MIRADRDDSFLSSEKVGNQRGDSVFDVVADCAHDVDGLAGGVGEFPVFVAFAGEVGLRDRTQLVVLAYEAGLVIPGQPPD